MSDVNNRRCQLVASELIKYRRKNKNYCSIYPKLPLSHLRLNKKIALQINRRDSDQGIVQAGRCRQVCVFIDVTSKWHQQAVKERAATKFIQKVHNYILNVHALFLDFKNSKLPLLTLSYDSNKIAQDIYLKSHTSYSFYIQLSRQ